MVINGYYLKVWHEPDRLSTFWVLWYTIAYCCSLGCCIIYRLPPEGNWIGLVIWFTHLFKWVWTNNGILWCDRVSLWLLGCMFEECSSIKTVHIQVFWTSPFSAGQFISANYREIICSSLKLKNAHTHTQTAKKKKSTRSLPAGPCVSKYLSHPW